MKKNLKKSLFGFAVFAVSSFAACAFDLNSYDFSVEVNVHNTESSVVTEPQKMNTELNAIAFTKLMGHGINLGNTLEAYRGWNGSTTRSPTAYETLWGQPVTTQEIMNAYKEAGFDCVRIPVAWTNMMNYEKGDYEIADAWLNRVEEVVNYALTAGLYVIINDHWDGQWWGMFGSTDENHRKNAILIYKSIWTQVANRFKNYDERLIFEGANEELGSRLTDDTVFSNKKKGNLNEVQCYAVMNKINQCFVDLVRNTGANNAYRFLLIPGYNTDINKTTSIKFKMPTDTVDGRLMVSVHYYNPSPFCILDEDASWGKCKNEWGTDMEISTMKMTLKRMSSFITEGYGVIIGEYGVAQKKVKGKYSMKDGTVLWMQKVVENCDELGFVPVLWDCNTFFKKTGKLGFQDEEMAAIYKK